MPPFLVGLIFNRYTLGLLVVLGVALGIRNWHLSAIDRAVEANDTVWTQKIEAERARHRDVVSTWVTEMVAREAAANATYAKAIAERKEVFLTLTKEVTRYVTQLSDSRCIVPVGLVQHHDAAAAARFASVPEGSSGSIDADSGLTLSTVEATVASNYAVCHDAIAEVKRWREWYAEFSSQWEKLRTNLAHGGSSK